MDYAKYVGTAGVRVMLDTDWRAAGIDKQETVQWDATNGFMVPRSRLSDDAWALLGNDPGIVFTGERPDAAEVDNAAVNAAKGRLLARQSGQVVLHKQDEIPVGSTMTSVVPAAMTATKSK